MKSSEDMQSLYTTKVLDALAALKEAADMRVLGYDGKNEQTSFAQLIDEIAVEGYYVEIGESAADKHLKCVMFCPLTKEDHERILAKKREREAAVEEYNRNLEQLKNRSNRLWDTSCFT